MTWPPADYPLDADKSPNIPYPVSDHPNHHNSLAESVNTITDFVSTLSTLANSLSTSVTTLTSAVAALPLDGTISQPKMATGLKVPVVCTSSTHPGSPAEGTIIYETDTDIQKIWDGAAWITLFQRDWTTFTPTVRNGGRSAVSTNAGASYAKYTRRGKTIYAQISMAVNAASGGTGQPLASLPVSSVNTSNIVGSMYVLDSSGSYENVGLAKLVSSTEVGFVRDSSVAPMTVALDSGDVVYYNIFYEAASF